MAVGLLVFVLLVAKSPIAIVFGLLATGAFAYQFVSERAWVAVAAEKIEVHMSRRVRPTIIRRDSLLAVNRIQDAVELQYRAQALFGDQTVIRRIKLKPHDPDGLMAALERPHVGTAVSSESEQRFRRDLRRDLVVYVLVLAAAISAGILIARLT